MKFKCTTSYTLTIISLLLTLTCYYHCGVVGVIEGGKKDTIPPVFLKSIPVAASVNVPTRIKKISLKFNEYLQLDKKENIIINPIPKHRPKIEAELRNILVIFDTFLRHDMTYHIDFQNCISDLNEKNIHKNFHFLFSTGNAIDTFSVSGRIINSKTARKDSTSIAILYPQNIFYDSIIYKKKPMYMARTDSNGAFRFKNLKAQNYYLFALSDKDNNLLYSSPSESFAFLNTPILYKDSRTQNDNLLFTYAKPPDPTPKSNKRKKNKIIPEYTLNAKNRALNRDEDIILLLSDTIKKIDKSKIKLYDTASIKDSSHYENEYIDSIIFIYDSLEPKIIIQHFLDLDDNYKLVLEKGFIPDTNYFMAKNDTLSIQLLGEEAYKKIHIACENCDSLKNPTILFYQGDKLLHTLPLKNGATTTPYLQANTYTLELLEDTNGNGIQDIGNFILHKEPEKIYPLKKNTFFLQTNPTQYQTKPQKKTQRESPEKIQIKIIPF